MKIVKNNKEKNDRKIKLTVKPKPKSKLKRGNSSKSHQKALKLNCELTKEKTYEKQDFFNELKKATENLVYISETDADILPFCGKISETLDSNSLLSQIEYPLNSPIEERDFEDFFERLIKIQTWFDEDHEAIAKGFLKLKNLLVANLKDLKVYKIGKIDIDIYVVGIDEENNIMGIKTKAIET